MECKIFKATDDYADEEIIIRDPYLFPRQHPVRSVALGGAAAVSLVFAFVLWSRCCPPMKEDRLKLKLCFWYQCLAAFGSLLEVAATAFLSENDGFALILMARVVTITSLGPLLAAANGMGETIWPSKRWQEVWIVSIIFLLASLAGFLTLSLMLRDFGLLTLGCIMATGASYAGALWLVAMYKVKFPRFFGQNAAGPIAAGCLVGSYLFLGFADLTCGPPGHADCYARCFVPEGGLHYLIWMGAAMLAHCSIWLFLNEDEPLLRIIWPKILTFRLFHQEEPVESTETQAPDATEIQAADAS